MPAEWETHQRTFVQWCEVDSLVYPDNYNSVALGYANTINAIAEFEPVAVIVSENTLESAKKLCKKNIDFMIIPHNDAWFRDNGPTFVRNSERVVCAVNWRFNSWGERFLPYDLDNAVAEKVLDKLNVRRIDSTIVLEGGSIHSNGAGTILTTRQCLLNANRNPHLSKNDIENELADKLGATNFIWLNNGLYGDETDGHVDNIACFSDENTVIIQVCNDVSDPNYQICEENLSILENYINTEGQKLNIIKIEQPPARYYNGIRLTLSYINFYIANGAIILPIFGDDADETDKKAIASLKKAFPNRKIVTVDGMLLIKEGGNVHCITQQMPL